MGLDLDSLFIKHLQEDTAIGAIVDDRIYDTSIELPDSELDNVPLPYIIVSLDGVRNGDSGKDFEAEAAGGFFIQPLPDATEDVLAQLEKNLSEVRSVSHMVAAGMDAKAIVSELLRGFPAVDYLATTELSFRCQCSKKRIGEVLLSLGRSELESLAEDGHAEVCCHFCGERYQFSGEELKALLEMR